MVRLKSGMIGRFYVPEIIEELETILGCMIKVLNVIEEDRGRWGYFTIRRREDGRVLLVAQIGDCPEEKAEKYMRLSLEKGQRLHHFRPHNDISSWQSRNLDFGRYGGAICAGPFIFSFSGLPEHADEAMMIRLASSLGLIQPLTCSRLANISKNPYLARLVKAHRAVKLRG